MEHKVIDIKGLRGPMPIIELGIALRTSQSKEILAVHSDDPAFFDQVSNYCKMKGHVLESLSKQNEVIIAVIQKK